MARLLKHLPPVAAALGVALLLAQGVLSSSLERESFRDWDQHVAYAEAAAASVRQYGEAPFWNPYTCGGVPLLAHPESRVLTPFFLLYLAMPPPVAMKWDIALHFAIAALGMLLLIRQEGGSVAAGLVAAFIFGGSTFFSLHLAEGHTWILSAAYAPLVLALYERGRDRLAWAGVAGALLALMVGEGGIYPAPHLCLLLGLYAVGLSLVERGPRPLLVLGLLFLVAALLAMPKLLPLLDFMGRQPRHVDSGEVLPARAILHALTDRHQAFDRPFGWRYWPWHEQGSYVGVVALLLAAVAVLATGRRSAVLCGVGVLFALLAAGSFARWAPWTLLHELPVFRSHHVPSRFLSLVVLVVALLAGRGAGVLLSWSPSPRLRDALAALLVLTVGADVLSARLDILGPLRCAEAPWPPASTSEPLFTLRRSPRRAACAYGGLAPSVRAGMMIVDAYETLCPRAGVRGLIGRQPGLLGRDEPGYRGEVWLEGTGSVELLARTQNSFTLRASPGASGVAVFNHNWDGGWRSDGGRLQRDEHERLTLTLEPGRQEYVLRYRPPYFIPSLVLWALGLLVLASLWVLPAGGPRRGAGSRGGRQAPADYGEGVGEEQGPQSTEQVEQSSPMPMSHV